jgi:hypothetical protein
VLDEFADGAVTATVRVPVVIHLAAVIVIMVMPVWMVVRRRVALVLVMILLIMCMLMLMVVLLLPVMMMPVFMRVAVLVRFVLVVRVRRACVDAKLHAFQLLPLFPLKVHVEIAEVELRELPFESGRFYAEIDERTNRHIAADTGETIEEEDFHGEELRV